MKIILYMTSIIIVFSSAVYLWKQGRFATSEMISVIAVSISIAVASFTFLSHSLPAKVDVISFNPTWARLPEKNRDAIFLESLWIDISEGITSQGKKIRNSILKEFDSEDFPKNKEEILRKLQETKLAYAVNDEIAKRMIGRKPCTIPIVLGISFINESPSPTVVREVLLSIEGENSHFLYRPWFYVDGSTYFTLTNKKTKDFWKGTTHPFLLPGKSERSEYFYFTKEKSFDKDGIEDNSIEITPGKYKMKLFYNYDKQSRNSDLPGLPITEDNILNLMKGGLIVSYNQTEFYKNTVNSIINK